MSDDYKIQVSAKYGNAQEGMVNVRANTTAELDATINDLLDVVPSLTLLSEQLTAMTTIQTAFPQAQQVPQGQPAQATYGGAQCAHGARVHRIGPADPATGRPQWEGDFCPLQKTDPNRCKPVYSGR